MEIYYVKTSIYSVLISCFLIGAVTSRNYNYEHYKPLDNQMVQNNLFRSLKALSRLDCARECGQVSNSSTFSCLSFSYNPAENMCRLYQLLHQPGSKTSVSNGTQNFNMVLDKYMTQDGYMCIVRLQWCYKFHDSPKRTFADAKNFCESEGSFLVTIDSEEKDTILSEERRVTYPVPFLTGITDLQMEGQFVDIHGNPITFSNWDTSRGQPNEYRSNEDCMILLVAVKWDDIDCNISNGFICDRIW